MSEIPVPIHPGFPKWSEAFSSELRQFLVSPTGQRFLARMRAHAPVVSNRDNPEIRRIESDTRAGFESAFDTILHLADPDAKFH